MDLDRLDIYTGFLLPAGCRPRRQKTIENTELMLEMVAAWRGVAALPDWLVDEYRPRFNLRAVQLGPDGLKKQLCLGVRRDAAVTNYIAGFLAQARAVRG